MYSTDPIPADAPPPTPELMAEMGKFVQESIKAGVMVTTGAAAHQGTRVNLAAGKYSVTDGPFIEAKELMGGFAVLEVKSLEEAIGWAKRFRDIVGDGTSEIVQIYGPNDLG
jgi:hypothetical protein